MGDRVGIDFKGSIPKESDFFFGEIGGFLVYFRWFLDFIILHRFYVVHIASVEECFEGDDILEDGVRRKTAIRETRV